MVVVPVRHQRCFDGTFLAREHFGQRVSPDGEALGRIYEQALPAGTEDIGVGALQMELLRRVSDVYTAAVARGRGGDTLPGLPPMTRITVSLICSTAGSGGRAASWAVRKSSWAPARARALVMVGGVCGGGLNSPA